MQVTANQIPRPKGAFRLWIWLSRTMSPRGPHVIDPAVAAAATGLDARTIAKAIEEGIASGLYIPDPFGNGIKHIARLPEEAERLDVDALEAPVARAVIGCLAMPVTDPGRVAEAIGTSPRNVRKALEILASKTEQAIQQNGASDPAKRSTMHANASTMHGFAEEDSIYVPHTRVRPRDSFVVADKTEEPSINDNEQTTRVRRALVQAGISAHQAARLLQSHPPGVIEEYLDAWPLYAEAAEERGRPIRNKAPFLIKAIQEGFQIPEAPDADADMPEWAWAVREEEPETWAGWLATLPDDAYDLEAYKKHIFPGWPGNNATVEELFAYNPDWYGQALLWSRGIHNALASACVEKDVQAMWAWVRSSDMRGPALTAVLEGWLETGEFRERLPGPEQEDLEF